jgi:hypothetical protein
VAWLIACGLCSLAVLGAAWLGWRAREAERSYAVLAALFLGPDEVPEARTDLRFATVAWAMTIVTLALVFLPWGGGSASLAFGLLGGVPSLAVAMALGASAFRRLPLYRRKAAEAREAEDLRELLQRARDELSVARDRVGGPQRDALGALEEALEEYASDLDQGTREGLAERLQGVIDMARSCLMEEARQAARELGVRQNASPAEVQRIYRALREIYGGDSPLPGVDPRQAERLELAHERLKLRFALEQSSRALRALSRTAIPSESSKSDESGSAPASVSRAA